MRKEALLLYHNVLEREQLSSLLYGIPFLHVTPSKDDGTLSFEGYDFVVCLGKDLIQAYHYKTHFKRVDLLILMPKNLKGMFHLLEDQHTRVVEQGCGQQKVIEAVSFLISPRMEVQEKRGNITKREHQILSLLISGQDTKTIAETLGIKVSTVTVHKKHLFYKSGVHNTGQLLIWALFTQYVDT